MKKPGPKPWKLELSDRAIFDLIFGLCAGAEKLMRKNVQKYGPNYSGQSELKERAKRLRFLSTSLRQLIRRRRIGEALYKKD